MSPWSTLLGTPKSIKQRKELIEYECGKHGFLHQYVECAFSSPYELPLSRLFSPSPSQFKTLHLWLSNLSFITKLLSTITFNHLWTGRWWNKCGIYCFWSEFCKIWWVSTIISINSTSSMSTCIEQKFSKIIWCLRIAYMVNDWICKC